MQPAAATPEFAPFFQTVGASVGKAYGDHPAFTLSLKVNFVSSRPAESFGVKFVGSEGVMEAAMSSVTLYRTPREIEPGHTTLK